jgi:hypothetical protein
MKFVPRGQTFAGKELHPLDSRPEPLESCGAIVKTRLLIEWLDYQADTLGFAQRQWLLGFENTMCEYSLGDLRHSISPPLLG